MAFSMLPSKRLYIFSGMLSTGIFFSANISLISFVVSFSNAILVHLDFIVVSNISAFDAINIITIYSGGSSNVFNKLFWASLVILSASFIINIFFSDSIGFSYTDFINSLIVAIFIVSDSSLIICTSGWLFVIKHVQDLHLQSSSLLSIHKIFFANSLAICFFPIPSFPKNK